ncbi:uncharacterized protein LOC105384075 [Plutella xylostella]|uniref:uncharacterized protein LOC105384075 n=1 Tax=Plutella xylostella TaxID=51655 RepID=UPI0020324622|nr:uncharacterized protein LOC105384075 [Plutella xylostella]
MRSTHPTAKKPPQIIFTKNTYSPGVKVENWDYSRFAEVKDNYVYRDRLSNQVSTYCRLGTQDQPFTTETREMLAQIHTKTDPVYTFKPLVNFTSYPCTDTPGRNKLMKNANLAQLPPDYGVMDYISTHQDDFRNPYPCVMKPLTMSSPPWMLNRVVRSGLTLKQESVPDAGDHKFLDDGDDAPLDHIRRMRMPRHLSFNPASGLQDFPCPNPRE